MLQPIQKSDNLSERVSKDILTYSQKLYSSFPLTPESYGLNSWDLHQHKSAKLVCHIFRHLKVRVEKPLSV